MIRLALRVRREEAELVLAELLELAPGGIEEVDLGATVEYAVYGAAGELPELPDLRAAAGGAFVEVSTTEVGDDWAARWRAFHRPVEVAGRVRVRPPWEPSQPPPGGVELVVDPGQAFGTGAHATTRMCLELLLGVPPQGSFADLGCGSGVLAIAAARLGFDPVLAVDNDPLSIAATADNAAVNGVTLELGRVDLRREEAPLAATATANLIGPLLLDVAPRLRPPRDCVLIASGLLRGEGDAVAAALAAVGLAEHRRLAEGDWAALLVADEAGTARLGT